MTTPEDLREALAALAEAILQTQAQTQASLQQTQADIRTLIGATGPAAAAGPAAVTALQIVRESSEATVQLSLSDTQYTVQEASAPTGLTAIYALPETNQADIDNKSEALLDFHRERSHPFLISCPRL